MHHDLHILQHFISVFCVPISVKMCSAWWTMHRGFWWENSPPRDPQPFGGACHGGTKAFWWRSKVGRAWNATCHPRFLKENYQNSFLVELNVKRLNKETTRIMTFLGAGIPNTKLSFAFVTSGKGSRYQRMLKSWKIQQNSLWNSKQRVFFNRSFNWKALHTVDGRNPAFTTW